MKFTFPNARDWRLVGEYPILSQFQVIEVKPEDLHGMLPNLLDAKAVGEKGFIAGSAARSVLTHEDYDDIDIFLYRWIDFGEVDNALRDLGYAFSRALYNASEYTLNGSVVQIIHPHDSPRTVRNGRPEAVLHTFDFIVNKVALYREGTSILMMYDERVPGDWLSRTLRLQSVPDPVAMVYRVQKYAKKGFTLDIDDMGDLFREWDKLTPPEKQACLDGRPYSSRIEEVEDVGIR